MKMTALVTGGTKRIGLHLTTQLLRRGYRVVATYNSGEGADAANRIFAQTNCLGITETAEFDVRWLDLRDELAIQKAVMFTEDVFGPIDLLINCAGAMSFKRFRSLTPTDWDDAIKTNLRSVFIMSNCVANRMGNFSAGRRIAEPEWGGSILNIADTSALVPKPGWSMQSVIKSGIVALTKAMAVELAPKIRVNCILPGHVLPPGEMAPARKSHLANDNLMERWGDPKDLAALAVTLAETPFVTGAVWNYTGGEELIGAGW